MYEIKTEDVYTDWSSYKEMFDFSNYSTKSKYYDDSNKLIIRKMKDETFDVVICWVDVKDVFVFGRR